MKLRNLLIAVYAGACSLLAACAFPGLDFEQGGSAAWKGQSGDSAAQEMTIWPIDPELIQYYYKRDVEAQQKRKQVRSYDFSPWEYRIGPGDLLSVIVWDHPELTIPTGEFQSVEGAGRLVRADGTIFFPHAGTFKVEGLSVEDVRQQLADSLSRVIESPQVDVRVIAHRSQFVYIVGDVLKPCKIPITDKVLTVIDAMNSCETIRPSESRRSVVIERGTQTRAVDVHALYRGQDPILNQPLIHGDRIYVEDDRWNRVFVVGEVNKQAALNIPVSGMTLADAMNDEQVGGLALDRVDSAEIYVFRGVSEETLASGDKNAKGFKPQVFWLDASSADALLLADQFKLEPRDIVYASTASLVNYNRSASLVMPSIQSLLQTGILLDRINN